MARLLQKSNQPSSNTGSWSGLFSCCFSSPKSESPTLAPRFTSINFQPTPNNQAEKSIWERDPGDGHSVTSAAGDAQAEKNQVPTPSVVGSVTSKEPETKLKRRVSARVEDENGKKSRPNGLHLAKQNSESTINISELYAPPSAVPTPKGGDSVPLSELAEGRSSLPSQNSQEFAEEHYNKGYSWQTSANAAVLETPAVVTTNVIVHTHIKLDYKTSDLQVRVSRVENAPGEEHAGSQSYQVRLTLLVLKKKKRWHTHIVPAPDPVFDEVAVFKSISPDELAKTALRIRLYGCKKLRRHFIFAESTVSFSALNFRGEADIPFTLASTVGHSTVVDSDSNSGDEISRMNASRMGSRLSLRSRTSLRSSLSRRSGSRSLRPPSAGSSTSEMPRLETARRVAANKEDNWPELLCGLSYNATTKHLNIHIHRANRLKVSESSIRSPKVFVSLTLTQETGEKVTSSRTHDVRLSANTEFGERFAFDLSALDPNHVTLFVRVFQKHHVHKREGLGWFAIGAKNNGEEERSHWKEMLQANGQEITRWHVLNENIA